MKIMVKFMLFTIPASVAAGLVAAIVIGWQTYTDLQADQQARADKRISTIAQAVAQPVWNYDMDTISNLVNDLLADTEIIRVTILEPQGAVLIDRSKDGAPESATPLTLTRNLVVDVLNKRRVIGEVRLVFSDSSIRAESQRIVLQHSLLTLLLAGVLIVMSIWATNRIFGRPLARYVDSLRQAEKTGEVGEVDWASRDELGELIATYNATLERVWHQERQLQNTVQQLTETNLELKRFAYVASHDLREPIRTICSFAELLQRKATERLTDEDREYLDFLIDGASRMNMLVDDLLSYSRVTNATPSYQRFDLNLALESALENLRLAIQESGARVEAQALPEAVGDQMQISLMFQNLVGNAIKYRHPDRPPVVAVDCFKTGDEWTIGVRDNGIGIDPRYRERIFEVFQRLHVSEAYEGSGIGLAICRRIAEQHGGRIDLDVTGNQGSRFIFTLPVMEP